MRAWQPNSLVHRQYRPLRLLLTFILIWVQAAPMAAPSFAASTNEAVDSAIEAAPAATAELSATKTDQLLLDKDGDGRADPGDTLRYTVTTTNTGTIDANNLLISDTLDPNTTLVAGSARISPLAMPDQFSTLENTPLTISAPGLLANDTGTPNPTVLPFNGTSTAGGLVTIQADGSFSYTPPNNFSGNDSFSYTASNSVANDNSMVTLVVESAPKVVSTTPANNATLVPANSTITVSFSEPVNLTANAFVLACPVGVPISFTNTTGLGPATSFTLTPDADMPETTVCNVKVVAAEISDADSNDPPDTLAADYSFSFTTTDAAPKLISTVPVSGTNPVAASSTIQVTFNESVQATTDSFVLECPTGTSLPFTLSASPASSYTLTPSAALPAGALCRVTVVASEISDLDSVDPPDQPVADEFFFFTVEAPPTVVSTTPANGANGVATDTMITIEFSEPVTVSEAGAFSIMCLGMPRGFTVISGFGPATSFVLDPVISLPEGIVCTITVFASDVSDADTIDPPDTMASNYTFTFTTDAAPTVVGTKPVDGATDQPTNLPIEVTFSEAVTLDPNAFTLECPTGSSIGLSISPSSGAATSFSLTPSSAIPANTTCTVTVLANRVHDADTADPPDTMASDFAFSFTTDAAPTVSSSTPADAASDQPTDTDITITFSEAVNVTANAFSLACPTGTSISFTNTTGTGPVTAFVLQPDADLPAGTTCTVTVLANEVSDADSADPPDTMAANHTFTFSTDAAPTVASSVPANNAAGVASSANITINFSEAVNLGGTPVTLSCASSSISLSNLTGSGPATSFEFDPATSLPIGTLCTVTVVANQVTDDDSADPPDTMLADYTFSFTTLDDAPTVSSHTPANSATTQATDTAITIVFSEPVNVTANAFALECPTGTPITLTNSTGTGPASSFSLQPNAALPQDSTCTMTVVADQVTDADSIDPPDTMASDYSFSFTTDAAPKVVSTTPVTGTIDVMLNTTIQVTFSESVQATTDSFELVCASTPVAFGLSASPATVFTLTPSANLPINTLCTVTVVAAEIHDVDAGDPPDTMAEDYTFSFTTVDDQPPTVTSTTPANGVSNLPTNGNIVVNFSESVNFSASSFTLECPSDVAFSLVGTSPANSVALDPTAALPAGATCTVTVLAAGISDADTIDPPDAMEDDYSFSFTTDAPPSVTSTTPANGASNLATDGNIVLNFSESVNFSTTSFTLECPTGAPVNFTLSSSPATSALINPNSDLPAGTTCTVTVLAAGISDADSADPPDAMEADYVFSFTTDAPPSVTSSNPADGATNLPTDGNIVLTFSESVNFSESSFTIGCLSNVAFSILQTSPAISVTLDPTANLPAGETCTVTVLAAGISDDDSNDPPDLMEADYVFSFSTDAAPSVTSTTPANGATNVARNANIVVNFSESVTFSASSFTLACPTGTPVTFTVSGSPGTAATLDPTGNLPAGVICTVTVLAAGISDVDSADPPDTMAANYVFSFTVPPDAVNDTYSPHVIGNVGVNTTTSTNFSVLTNDEGPAITITAFDASSVQGGTVGLNTTTGMFSYTPPRGYEGSDSFTYTISNPAGSDVGTVNLTVSGMIWFVNGNVGTNGDGRLNTPYNSLATLNDVNNGTGGNPAAGDTIFLYGSGTNYAGPITLLNNQKLVGQNAGVGLASLAGVTVPADSFVLPTMGGAVPSSIITGNGITLGSNNTIRGLLVGDTPGNISLAGTNFGTLFVRELGISGQGQALSLNTGTLDTVFNTLTSTSGTNNVALQNVSGTLSVASGTLSGATGTAFVNDGGSAAISYPGPISKTSAGLLLNITNRTATAVTLNGALTCNSGCSGISMSNNSGGSITLSGAATLNTGANTAVSLTNNTGTSIAFNGALGITTTTGNGVSASGGGTLTIAPAVNIIASTTGTAVSINGVTIGAAGVTFRSVTANGAANGIVLNNTGSGPFTVAGNGTANSGGIIQNTTGPGVLFTNTGPVSLNWMRVANSQDDGIYGSGVNGFTLTNSIITNNGNQTCVSTPSVVVYENGIELNNTTGTLTISDSTVTQSYCHNVLISNTSGTLSAVNVTGSTFSSPLSVPMDGLSITLPSGSPTITAITVTNNTFTNNTGDAIGVNAEGSSTIGMFTFSGNTLTGNDIGVNVSSNGTASVKFDINNNPTMHGTRTQVNIAANDMAAFNGVGPTMEGYVRNNPNIKVSSAGSVYLGMWVVAQGDGHIVVDFTNNRLFDFGETGLAIEPRQGSGSIHATIRNNIIEPSTATEPVAGLWMRSGNGTPDETSHICANVIGNNINAGPAASADYLLSRYLTTSTFSIQGLTPTSATGPQAAAFIQGTDIAPPATAFGQSGLSNYTAATCQTPSFALQAADGEGPGAPSAQLDQAQLDAAVDAAIERWDSTGISAVQREQLRSASVQIADLDAGLLGSTFGPSIEIDRDAAGWGWSTNSSQTSSQHYDLLTVVQHELGHVLGEEHTSDSPHALMANTLKRGERRSLQPQLAQVSPAVITTTPSSVDATVGTLPAGKRVILVFDVVINSPLPESVTQIANQARLSATGLTTILSDDPERSGTADPTITQLDTLKKVYLPLVMKEAPSIDLAVISITLSPNKKQFSAGEPVEITLVIKNEGQTASPAFWVDLYINPSQVPSASSAWNELCQLDPCYGMAWPVPSGLAAGESITLSSKTLVEGYSIWPGYFAAGTNEIYVQADSWRGSGAMLDINRANNLMRISGLQVTGSNPSSTQSLKLRQRPAAEACCKP